MVLVSKIRSSVDGRVAYPLEADRSRHSFTHPQHHELRQTAYNGKNPIHVSQHSDHFARGERNLVKDWVKAGSRDMADANVSIVSPLIVD